MAVTVPGPDSPPPNGPPDILRLVTSEATGDSDPAADELDVAWHRWANSLFRSWA